MTGAAVGLAIGSSVALLRRSCGLEAAISTSEGGYSTVSRAQRMWAAQYLRASMHRNSPRKVLKIHRPIPQAWRPRLRRLGTRPTSVSPLSLSSQQALPRCAESK
ncbi:hypothetical protein CF336_g6481 [Tilletia laevis]|nr:hypothetical protein CF336_g6481 [Tilletia laevis]